MLHMLEEQPWDIDPEFPARIRAKVKQILAEDDGSADTEIALLDLKESVSDALHMGKVDFDMHDALHAEIRDAIDTLLD